MKKVTMFGLIILGLGFIISLVGLARFNFNLGAVANGLISTTNAHYGKSYTKNFKPFHRVRVNADADVTVKYGKHYQVVANDAKRTHTSYELKNGILTITNDHKSNYSFHFTLFGWSNEEHSTKLTITIPNGKALDNYQQDNSNSNLKMDGIKLNSQLNLRGINDINLNQVRANSVFISSNDGDVSVVGSKFKQDGSKIDCQEGDSYLAESTFKALDVNSIDGDITLRKNAVMSGQSKITNTDGDISMGNNDWHQLMVTNSDGDISFGHQLINQSLSMKTNDGDISGAVSIRDNALISIKTSDGGESISSDLKSLNGHKPYQFQTTDGDISIHKTQ
ncbi:DUF4097 domain-containing protein (plasmid) [Nicoliella spurrieriana]|uniref:DUF4097 domain-containing protein n=1 Tax=Nicoliella spurrieriana TaxID=2925830 RepID=A0A976RQJ0_9LACO|nr:DUF4097 domain-containing protein [Nicoliella spurrieriana]UQS85976.1 DUF4097 domain-containing protein [Nicoliella spurrieriana]